LIESAAVVSAAASGQVTNKAETITPAIQHVPAISFPSGPVNPAVNWEAGKALEKGQTWD